MVSHQPRDYGLPPPYDHPQTRSRKSTSYLTSQVQSYSSSTLPTPACPAKSSTISMVPYPTRRRSKFFTTTSTIAQTASQQTVAEYQELYGQALMENRDLEWERDRAIGELEEMKRGYDVVVKTQDKEMKLIGEEVGKRDLEFMKVKKEMRAGVVRAEERGEKAREVIRAKDAEIRKQKTEAEVWKKKVGEIAGDKARLEFNYRESIENSEAKTRRIDRLEGEKKAMETQVEEQEMVQKEVMSGSSVMEVERKILKGQVKRMIKERTRLCLQHELAMRRERSRRAMADERAREEGLVLGRQGLVELEERVKELESENDTLHSANYALEEIKLSLIEHNDSLQSASFLAEQTTNTQIEALENKISTLGQQITEMGSHESLQVDRIAKLQIRLGLAEEGKRVFRDRLEGAESYETTLMELKEYTERLAVEFLEEKEGDEVFYRQVGAYLASRVDEEEDGLGEQEEEKKSATRTRQGGLSIIEEEVLHHVIEEDQTPAIDMFVVPSTKLEPLPTITSTRQLSTPITPRTPLTPATRSKAPFKIYSDLQYSPSKLTSTSVTIIAQAPGQENKRPGGIKKVDGRGVGLGKGGRGKVRFAENASVRMFEAVRA